MRSSLPAVIWLALTAFAFADEFSGDAKIESDAGVSKIVIRTTSRLAGAIDSLTWQGKEFINSADHGRQLQSACSFHDGKGRFVPETFNPTEAGSRFDGAGPKSTSKLLSLTVDGNRLATKTQMAFWLKPGERSAGQLARNEQSLSNHQLTKRVTIGVVGLPHAIEYVTTFRVPDGEEHLLAQFESVTGYMPPEFAKFYTFDVETEELTPLSDGPGEQPKPIIFATADGKHAMGVWSPDQPSEEFGHAGYGRFRFKEQKVVKWNCVFRVRNREGIVPGEYTFRSFVAVGTLEDVKKTLRELPGRIAEQSEPGVAP